MDIIKRLSTDNLSALVAECVKQLRRPGAVLLVPTETVYGLVCDWQDQAAIERIYRLKQRDYGKPLALFVAGKAMLQEHGISLPQRVEKLIDSFCPGPLTLVFPGNDGSTVGIRIPDYPFILALLEAYGRPLASTSANHSGDPNALTVAEAKKMLNGAVDIAVDAGAIAADAQASTVVKVSSDSWQLLRSGPISEQAIDQLLASV